MRFGFGILGPLDVRADGAPVHLGGPRARALLALLLLHPNEPVAAEAAAVALWGEDAPAGAAKAVQVHVSRLRRALRDPEALTTTGAGYALRVRPGELDAERFAAGAEAGRAALGAGRPQEASALLRDALALWRGPPLADVPFEPFAAEAAALEEQRLAAIEARNDADLACGRHAELVPELQRLVAAHPLRERLHAQLMLALYRGGRQADALAAYRHARDTLVEELGIEPGGELRELEAAVLAQSPELAGAAPAPAAVAEAERPPPVRVPAPPTPTVGRARDVERLTALLGDGGPRLVTVVGPGGVGKTRVAVETARALGGRFADGACFAGLAGVRDAGHVAATIARALDVSDMRGERVEDALAARLARRELLLVLDNFEHVLEAAPLVADLLAAAPGLRVLATSREPLRLRAEHLLHLDPLEETPAVALFVEAARARDETFALRPADAAAARIVCRRLDGLPLAIELAAARVGMLSPAQLAERLADGLEALGTAPRDAPARQRTLAATVEWSHALLGEAERDAFSAFAVFAGGATVEAALAVTRAPPEALEALVDKSLVRAHTTPAGTRRLEMLETIRELALRKLEGRPDAAAIRTRHLRHHLALAERGRVEMEGAGGVATVAALDVEVDNMRAALRWALERADAAAALALGTALTLYWDDRELNREGADWLAAALALEAGGVPPAIRGAALEAYANCVDEVGDHEAAEAAARESLEIFGRLGDTWGQARALVRLADIAMMVHRAEDAFDLARDGERLARAAGDEWTAERALRIMALGAPTLEESLRLGDRVAAVWRAAGRVRELSVLHSSLAYSALHHGDPAAAASRAAEALELARSIDAPGVEALACGNAGLAELFLGHLARASESFSAERELSERVGIHKLAFEALNGLAAVAAATGDDRRAARLAGAADAATPERHDPVVAAAIEERFLGPARRRLGEEAWAAGYGEGVRLARTRELVRAP